MKTEAVCLVGMSIFFMFAWLPTSLAKAGHYGKKYLFSNRDAKDLPPLPAWAQRADRAYENLKSYFPAFIVAEMLVIHLEISTDATKAFSIIYVAGRLLHYFSYTFGSVKGRAVGWMTALFANLLLLIFIATQVI